MDLDNGVKINFEALTDAQLEAARTEVQVAGESRGLWTPEAAGQLVVAQVVDIDAERARLLGTVNEGASLFNAAVESINSGRKKKDQIPVKPVFEYHERAEDWLTDSRVTAAAQLPDTFSRPRIVIPRLDQHISNEEVVDSWQSAADGRLWRWYGRMNFLNNWTANQLSGFDPEQSDEDRLEVVATAYDKDREGTVAEQKANLEALRTEFPELDAATIFDGAVVARRYMNQSRDWRDSYVRGITLESVKVDRFDCVPDAFVRNGGFANVYDSYVDGDLAARLRVR